MLNNLSLKNTYSHEFDKAVQEKMDAPIAHFEHELTTIRTGRAHPSMIEGIMVTAYGGTQMKLKEVAAISVPDARLLMVQPWDKSIIADIEKGILASHLGITPVNDGDIIRIQLPEVSGERREELVKALGKKLEDCRNRIRTVRNDFRSLVKKAEQDREISEDFSKVLQNNLQKITDQYMAKAQTISDKKEKDIRAV
ncbi:ribosome recycling factor [Candidatus Babeliales bacterium]|nr:ribosome recycling factor [Candidatus Babeliales bacterium]